MLRAEGLVLSKQAKPFWSGQLPGFLPTRSLYAGLTLVLIPFASPLKTVFTTANPLSLSP